MLPRSILTAVLVWLPVGTALADGAYFTGGEFEELAETTHQQAALVFNNDSTILILQTGYAGDGSSFSWVVPAEKQVTSEDVWTHESSLFDRLHDVTSPKLVTFMHGCGAAGCAAEDSRTEGSSTVTVYDSFEVDEYDITVLSATQSTDLSGWLTENGYNVPPGAGAVFQNYVSRGFYFVAVKFEGAASIGGGGGGGGAAGRAKPLAMRFSGQVTAFPLLISSLSTTKEIEMVLYTIAGERYRIKNFPTVDVRLDEGFEGDDFTAWYDAKLRKILARVGDAAFGVEFADDLRNTHYYGPDLIQELGYEGGDNGFVTRLHGYIQPRAMDQDLQFEKMPPQQIQKRLRVRVIYGGEVRAAIVSVPWDLALVALLALALARRSRRRRTA